MQYWPAWFRQRRYVAGGIQRGKLPDVSVKERSIPETIVGNSFIVIAAIFLLWTGFPLLHITISSNPIVVFLACAIAGLCIMPVFIVRYSGWKQWQDFPSGKRWVVCSAVGFFLVLLVGVFAIPVRRGFASLMATGTWVDISSDKVQFLFSAPVFLFYAWPVTTMGFYLVVSWLVRDKQTKAMPLLDKKTANVSSFSLWLGESTGQLARLWHPANMAQGQQVSLSLEDAAQNILVLGAIGSGKTTRAMHPLLVQLLDQDCGGLIFDIKGDFQKAVTKFATAAGREPVVIGINRKPFNLLSGLTPEIAASFLKSVLLLGGNTRSDTFWIDTATELCRNVLGILTFIPGQYHLNGLYRYLFDNKYHNAINDDLQLKILEGTDKRRLDACQHYITSIFGSFDDKVKTGVMASVAQILSSFQHPELVDAFCAPDKPSCCMEDVLDGTLYLVDMPLSQWGMAGKVIYTMLKLRFFNVMQQRVLHHEWNQTRPVFFMCDEYQEIVSCNRDGLSDLNFWDKSRSSKTIGIISAQSVSSFYAAIGDRDLVHALLQNFRQKLIFRTEDDWTVSYCSRLVSRVDTRQIVESSGTHGKDKSPSSNRSVNIQQRDVVDGQLFRSMAPDQVLALLSMRGYAADDVLEVKAVFG